MVVCVLFVKTVYFLFFFVTFLHSVFRDTLYIRRPLTLELCVVQTKKKSSSNSFGPKSIFTLWREKNPKRSLDPISKKWNFLIKFWIWIIFGSRLKPLYLLDQVLLLGQNCIFGSKCLVQTKIKDNILIQNEFLDQNQFSLQSLFNL